MVSYKIIEGSEIYIGDKKSFMVELSNDKTTIEQYVELERSEYYDINDQMEYAESEEKIELYLENLANKWEESNF